MPKMNAQSKYSLSFTAVSLRLNEMVKVAQAATYTLESDTLQVNDDALSFKSGKAETSRRFVREIVGRLSTLSHQQLNILANGDYPDKKQIAFLAICKYYSFIHDFTIEVIRDKALVFNYQINDADWALFLDNKRTNHPELDAFSETTLKKAKQVMFLILEQAGMINNAKDKTIQPQVVSPGVLNAILSDNPQWLRVFLIPDNDIKQAMS